MFCLGALLCSASFAADTGAAKSDSFPAAPGSEKLKAAFPTTRYDGSQYATSGSTSGSAPSGQPVPPSRPPLAGPSAAAADVVAPLKPTEVKQLRDKLDGFRRATAYQPVRAVPRINTLSVDLSPGAKIPVARTLPGKTTTILFLDSTGQPWPLAAAPRVSDDRNFSPEWIQDTAAVVITAKTSYDDANLTAFLYGLATPVVVSLTSGEPDTKSNTRVVDVRLDLRIPGRGPNAIAPIAGVGRIALYDETLQAFLDGLPPQNAIPIAIHGAPPNTRAWQYDGQIFVRTSGDMQSPFDKTISSADGTHVYRLPPTPYITVSDQGRIVSLQLDLH
ncbi:conjugal transfer protein TraN [Xenophilus sp. AP218F]|nr:conjugal transfer protein TraN [Xenophilus sp. AP218F]